MSWRLRHVVVTATFFLLVLLFFHTLSYSKWTKSRHYDTLAAHADSIHRHAVHAADHVWKTISTPKIHHDTIKSSTAASRPSSKPKCRLTKVTMLYGPYVSPVMEAAQTTHRLHSERWGCGFTTLQRDLTNRTLYSKQYYLLSILLQELAKPEDERQQWLLWLDADSILINPALSPEIFLPTPALNLKDVYALVTADHNGLNAGVFFLKVHPAAADLMARTVVYPLEHPDVDLSAFGEQTAMANVIKDIEAKYANSSTANFSSTNSSSTNSSSTNSSSAKLSSKMGGYPGIVWVPRDWFNRYQNEDGYPGYVGDMQVHVAGLTGKNKLVQMQKWIDELKENQTKWEMPVEKTRYPHEIGAFWRQFVVNHTRGFD